VLVQFSIFDFIDAVESADLPHDAVAAHKAATTAMDKSSFFIMLKLYIL
jgi:hypothetical protein